MAKGQIKLENGSLTGEIRTYAVCVKFKLETATNRSSDKSPSHRIIGRAPAGHAFEAGVAWEKEIRNGESKGQTCFMLQFDDPAFGAEPVYFNAWPDNKIGGWYIEAERQKRTSDDENKEAA